MRWIQKFLGLSLPLKLIVGSIVGAVAGPGLVGVMSEYASYAYALEIGVRPPLEGIPYLSATAALASLVIAVLAAFVFILTRWVISRIGGQVVEIVGELLSIIDKGIDAYQAAGGNLFKKISARESLESIRNLPLKKVIVLSGGLSAALVGLVNVLPMSLSDTDANAFSIVIALYVTVAIFTIWSRSFAFFVAGAAVVAFYVVSLGALFDTEKHREFLRLIGYGGEIPIQVEFGPNESVVDLSLSIRTTTALLGRPTGLEGVVEIPLSRVKSISYLPMNQGTANNAMHSTPKDGASDG